MDEVLCLGIELVANYLNEGIGFLCARQTRGFEHALHGVVLRHRSGQA